MDANSSPHELIRVMLVDDSAVVRGLMSRALQQEPRIHIVATASDGDMAISVLQRNAVDVIVLDIEMPKKDGLEALPILKALSPDTHVIMASSLTQRNASISLKALEMGAADYIPKPTSRGDQGAIDAFYHELQMKVLELGAAARQRGQLQSVAPRTRQTAPAMQAPPATNAVSSQPTQASAVSGEHNAALRTMARPVAAIAIASSTGGPQALVKLLSLSRASLGQVPIFITQHMPPTFTTLLAEHLSTDTGLSCKEAVHGELVAPGTVYIAPGDYHMQIVASGSGKAIQLNQDPPVNFCRPAADPMIMSLATLYGRHLLVLVLTGMGNDGCAGARAAKEAGGTVVVQDKESSVVWGMPGSVVSAQLEDAVMDLPRMSQFIAEAVR